MTLVSAGNRVREIQALLDTNASKMHTAEMTVQQTEILLSFTKIYAPANGHVLFDKKTSHTTYRQANPSCS